MQSEDARHTVGAGGNDAYLQGPEGPGAGSGGNVHRRYTGASQWRFSQGRSRLQAVLRVDPSSAAAYSNLGVIAMRKKGWVDALGYLHKAEQLDPPLLGVRLNVGLGDRSKAAGGADHAADAQFTEAAAQE